MSSLTIEKKCVRDPHIWCNRLTLEFDVAICMHLHLVHAFHKFQTMECLVETLGD